MNGRIVLQLHRSVRRRLERQMRRTRDAALRTRIRIVLLYHEGWGAKRIAEALGCVPATALRVAHRFLEQGDDGLVDGRQENGCPKVDADLLQALAELAGSCPEEHGWQRPTWTRELLARALGSTTGVSVSVTTVARMLDQIRARWGMARPTVGCPWSKRRKQRHLRALERTLRALPPREMAFFEDEVDIHLNPRIGRDWMLPRQQKRILTPGQNRKAYLAGAVSMDGRRLVFVRADRKNSDLFIALLKRLRKLFPWAKRIHLVLDNYIIHTSRRVQRYLADLGDRIALHLLPPYSPDANHIERLWRELHANVTRNHRCRTLDELMKRVLWYLRREARGRLSRRPQPLRQITLAAA